MKPEEQDIQVVVPTVEVSPTYSLFGPRRDMEYYLTPRSQFYSKNIARMVNSGYIPKKEIAGWKLDKTKYNPEYHGSREDFRKLKQDARHNKRELKKAMRYAGSDQQSMADRELYGKLGNIMTGVVAAPLAAEATGTLLGGIPQVSSAVAKVFSNPMLAKFGKDMAVGMTASMLADGAIRLATPYHGIADGLVKQGAKLYYDWKYPDFKHDGEIVRQYKREDGTIDWDKARQTEKAKADAASQKDYNEFLNSGAYPAWLMGAEFLNPVNWLNPTALATKTGLSRRFDKLDNEIIDGFIDPINSQLSAEKALKTEHLEVENLDPKKVFELFRQNPKLQFVSDIYHRAKYTRHGDRISLGDIDKGGGTFVDDPNNIIIAPRIEMNPEGYNNLLKLVMDIEGKRQILLPGNIFNARHGFNSPHPITSTFGIVPENGIAASEAYKSQILRNIDQQISAIKDVDFNGQEITVPILNKMRQQFVDEPLFINRSGWSSPDGTIDDLESIPTFRVRFNGDFIDYGPSGHATQARIKTTRFPRPFTFTSSFPEASFTFFDGLSKSTIRGVDGVSRLNMNYRSTPLNLVRNLANTIDNPNIAALVDTEGNVNLAAYRNLKKQLAAHLNKSEDEINQIFTSGRSTTEGVNSLDNHLMQVARSAQELPLPEGYTRQEAVTAALLHDLGKVISGNDPTHAKSSINLIKALNIPGVDNPKIRGAIEYHMRTPELNLFANEGNMSIEHIDFDDLLTGIQTPNVEVDSNFASFLHLADVARGLSLDDTKRLFPHLFSYNYPKASVLKGDPAEQMHKINTLLSDMGYGNIDTSLPVDQQWKQLQSIMKQMNTFVRGSRMYLNQHDSNLNHIENLRNAKQLAIERGLDPENPKILWQIAQEHVPLHPTGSGRLNLFDVEQGFLGTKHSVRPYSWSEILSLDPKKMDALYVSVSPETGHIYATASNPYSYSGQSTVLRGELKDYDVVNGESPFEYFERLYPYIHRYDSVSNYKDPKSPLSEFNFTQVASTLLGQNIQRMSRHDALTVLRKYFSQSELIQAVETGKVPQIAHTIQNLSDDIVSKYEQFGFSKLDAILNNLVPKPPIKGASVVDLPNYRNNMIFETNSLGLGEGPSNAGIGSDFQGIIIAPKGKKVFTVLDKLDVNGYPKSSSGAFRDAGGDNIRVGLHINRPFYKAGGKLCKKQ